ncbi:hypothetical protein [Bacillus infantis]|uniref:Uncharacterized protein n=1 Tax=Bacillus infantis TaxID=324767 RepID=A0A5D4RGW4_9BACI|nr:hypothetical protein [Bacillus infantis]TYS50100.1 hypothetical protein FZD51_05985 [Bacillus infantis]
MIWENEWFVGITVGLISGFIIYFIQIFVARKLSKKEYNTRIGKANDEVVSLLKAVISEDEYPSIEIFESLVSSISRKNNVEISDLNSVSDILDDLIAEVFLTNFMPVDKKLSSAEKLTQLKTQYKEINQNAEQPLESGHSISISYSRLMSITSTMFIMLFGYLIVLFGDQDKIKLFGDLKSSTSLIVSVVTSVVVMTLLSLFLKDSDDDKIAATIRELKMKIKSK